MTRFLEPLRRRDIDARAESFLQSVGVDRSVPIDIEQIVERRLGLTLFIGRAEEIDQTDSVLGAIFFDHSEVFINEILMGAEGRFRFTLAHEVGHWVLHQGVVDPIDFAWPFVPGKRGQGRLVLCRNQDVSMIEVQANMFAASLLMPFWAFANRIHHHALDMKLARQDGKYQAAKNQFETLVRNLANEFGVSNQAVRYRVHETSLLSLGNPEQLRLLL